MGKKKKTVAPQHEFPFKLTNLKAYDMEMLNAPLVPEIVSSDNPRLIASAEEDGVGDLLEVPFDEIIEMGRVTDNEEDTHSSGMDSGTLYLHVKTTEGEAYWAIFDFRVIHY